MKSVRIFLVVLLAIVVSAQSSDDDFVDFPLPNYNHDWYSGYLNITLTKDIHYMFFESQNDRDNDPVILWMNGGPGCSSLYGMAYENGPFVFDAEKANFRLNDKAWNKRANLLYFETPAGVGFSRGPVNSSDADTAKDNIYALREFFARFPTFRKNQLYLAGEGYAGIYIPYLALRITDENQSPIYPIKINLKGILLGNPCTHPSQCYAAVAGTGAEKNSYYHYEFLFNHQFYSERQFGEFKGDCGIGYDSATCTTRRQRLDGFFNSAKTSYYNIYSKCYNTGGEEFGQKIYQNGFRASIVNRNCEDEFGMNIFFNDQSIQKKLHVTPGNWTNCNKDIFAAYTSNASASYWIYPRLIAKNYRIWIYSGDLDSSVPITGTTKWISQLKEEFDIPIRKTWREWWVPGKHPNQDQVGGMVWQLEGLTFATLKNSGFTAGRDQPVALFQILDAFLNNNRLPLTRRSPTSTK